MLSIFEIFRRRLINLSKANKSLLLLRPSVRRDLDICALDFLNGQNAYTIIEALTRQDASIDLCAVTDSRNAATNQVSARLTQIERQAEQAYQEQGSYDLYVGWPFVWGALPGGGAVRAPLVLFSVRLAKISQHWHLLANPDEPPALNQSFLLAYSHFAIQALPESLYEHTFESSDSQSFLNQLYELLKNSALEIDFNSELFEKKLDPFASFKRAEYEKQLEPGRLRLHSEAIVGLFPQAEAALLADYDSLISQNLMLENIWPNADKSQTDDVHIIDADAHLGLSDLTPLPADASQQTVLDMARLGHSLVVQGPPGTGKSQLLTNLMADFAARGKSVLMVSQKRAAMEVIYTNLENLGLQPFSAIVHDARHDRAALYRQIARQIDHAAQPQAGKTDFDSGQQKQLIQDFERNKNQSKYTFEELDEFKTALFDDSICGISAKQLYLSAPASPMLLLNPSAYTSLRFDADIDYILDQINYLSKLYADFTNPAPLWKIWRDTHYLSTNNIADVDKALMGFEANWATYSPYFRTISAISVFYPHYKMLNELSDKLKDIYFHTHFSWLAQGLYTKTLWKTNVDKPSFPQKLAKQHQDWVLIVEQVWNTDPQIHIAYLSDPLAGLQISNATTNVFQIYLKTIQKYKAQNKLSRWYARGWGSFKKNMAPLLDANPGYNLNDIDKLENQIIRRIEAETKLLASKPKWLSDYPASLNIDAHKWWNYRLDAAFWLQTWVSQSGPLLPFLPLPPLLFLEKILSPLVLVLDKANVWQANLTANFQENQIKYLEQNPKSGPAAAQNLADNTDIVLEIDHISSKLSAGAAAALQTLSESALEPAIWATSLRSSLEYYWLIEIEKKFVCLKKASLGRLDALELQAQNLYKTKLELSKTLVQVSIKQKATDVLANKANASSYKHILRQTSKKRNIWPVRRLMASYAKEIFGFMPCWFASPEAVSQLFPLDKIFDLILFDEASQCFAEHGLPAICRGSQIIVAGDSMQLQPQDLYRQRWQDQEAEDDPETESASLLDFSSLHLPQARLQGHYRSRSVLLIEFSNKHFYQNSLQALPYKPNPTNSLSEPAIEYHKLDGIWQDNSNIVEAEYIVQMLLSNISSWKGQSVGIVCFNIHQQNLIINLVEQQPALMDMQSEWRLFVKNIENVQGDERDIIVFSIGYGPDPNGRILMNFGSLNQSGGQNRLNVAISRARNKMLIVCSIFPSQLRTGQQEGSGPALLQAYLEYSLQVSQGKYVMPTGPAAKPGQQYLKTRLADAISPTQPAWPFADLLLKDKLDREIGSAILLTDDDLYQSQPVKVSYCLAPMALKAHGWPIQRIYSREFWQNKIKLVEKIENMRGN